MVLVRFFAKPVVARRRKRREIEVWMGRSVEHEWKTMGEHGKMGK